MPIPKDYPKELPKGRVMFFKSLFEAQVDCYKSAEFDVVLKNNTTNERLIITVKSSDSMDDVVNKFITEQSDKGRQIAPSDITFESKNSTTTAFKANLEEQVPQEKIQQQNPVSTQ